MTQRFWLTLLVLSVWLMPLRPVRAAAAPSSGRPSAFRLPAAPSGGQVGDGTPGSCIESALDAKLAGGGTVTFSCGGPIFFYLTTVKTITQTTTIDGTGGITLDGTGSVAIFSVTPTVTLSLKNITLNQAYGGASDGGAIKNHGTLYLDNSIIQSSRTDSSHSGGAIFSDGPLFITNSTLQDNQAGSAGALFANFGQASVTISNSTFQRNQAIDTTFGYGGAIWVGEKAQVFITGGAIISNSAQFGGGLYVTATATVTLTSTGAPAIVSGNTATGAGGGIYNTGGSVTLTNATLSGNSATQNGGGIGNESGSLTLANDTFSGNSAGSGGGISNDQVSAAATLTGVTLSGNSAHFGGGGIYNNHGAATLANVVISGNVVSNTFGTSTYGGGIENYGTLTVTNATLSGNSATNNLGISGFGGGIYNNQYSNQDTLTLLNSTVSGNSAYAGGGILNAGTLRLTNSTLTANSATSTGGGVENYEGTAMLTNATLSGNSASSAGGLYEYNTVPTQTITLKNTIVASGSSGANCTDAPSSVGVITSNDYNLSSEGTCAPYFNQPSDLNNKNPNLGPLTSNGGPTLTHMPQPGSPAIDVIPNGTNGCGTTVTSDQRGAPRPINGKCDIGAVESGWAYPRLWLPLIRR
jgi:hypothetical protein